MSLTRILLGFALALGIGVLCRVAGLPLPAPPAIVGALLVVSMTLGFIGTDWAITRYTKQEADL